MGAFTLIYRPKSGARMSGELAATLEPHSRLSSMQVVAAAKDYQFGRLAFLLRSDKLGKLRVVVFDSEFGKKEWEKSWDDLLEDSREREVFAAVVAAAKD